MVWTYTNLICAKSNEYRTFDGKCCVNQFNHGFGPLNLILFLNVIYELKLFDVITVPTRYRRVNGALYHIFHIVF